MLRKVILRGEKRLSPAHRAHKKAACSQPKGHKKHPRAVPGLLHIQLPEKRIRHLRCLPPFTIWLPMLFKVRVQVCDAGTKSLLG